MRGDFDPCWRTGWGTSAIVRTTALIRRPSHYLPQFWCAFLTRSDKQSREVQRRGERMREGEAHREDDDELDPS